METLRKIYLTKRDAFDAAVQYAEIRDAKSGRMTELDADDLPECSDKFALCVPSWAGTAPAVAVDKGRDTIAEFGWWCESDEEFVEGYLERQDGDAKYTVTKVEWYEHWGVNASASTFIFATFRWEDAGNSGMSAALINPRRSTCWTLADWQLQSIPISASECENYEWRDLEHGETVPGDEILNVASER